MNLPEPKEVAKQMCSVQPINNIDWNALAQHPLCTMLTKELGLNK